MFQGREAACKPRPKPKEGAKAAKGTPGQDAGASAQEPLVLDGGQQEETPAGSAMQVVSALAERRRQRDRREQDLWRVAYRPGASGDGDPTSLAALKARAMIECGGVLKGKLRVKPKAPRGVYRLRL